jgi:hypothetical protein
MKKYKVEIVQKEIFVVDVKAESEKEAKKIATDVWNGIAHVGTYHYRQQGDTQMDFGIIYDVTETDDPFQE